MSTKTSVYTNLYEYLVQKYNAGSPIFLADIRLPGATEENIRYSMKRLVDNNVLRRFDSGIYYFPKKDFLGDEIALSSDTVALYKYVLRNGSKTGYYSGLTFANKIGLSTQVPFVEEITSNQAPAPVREIAIKNQKYIIRRPVVRITNDNIMVLQLLDCLSSLEQCTELPPRECGKILADYIIKFEITKDMIDEVIEYFPTKIYKAIYETEIFDVFTRTEREF